MYGRAIKSCVCLRVLFEIVVVRAAIVLGCMPSLFTPDTAGGGTIKRYLSGDHDH